MNTKLYSTTVVHERFSNFKNKFKYSVFSMCIDYDELKILTKKIKIFSYNKFNIFSYNDKDHGYRDGRSLRKFVEKNLIENNFFFEDLKIQIICFPRIFGYVFNPLSIIYCYNESKLVAVFYEVKNTSNEQHTYFFASHEKKNIAEYKHQCDKNFYVSPFIGMKALYKFRNQLSEDKMSINIDLFNENNQKILTASQYGKKISLNSFTLFRQLTSNPLITIKIIVGILYEAFFIFFKGGQYYSREKKMIDTISFEGKL
jgi:DUF1365 family protein